MTTMTVTTVYRLRKTTAGEHLEAHRERLERGNFYGERFTDDLEEEPIWPYYSWGWLQAQRRNMPLWVADDEPEETVTCGD